MNIKVKKFLFFGVLPFILFSFAAIYITFPLIFHLGDYVTGYGDEFIIAWIQNWVIHTLTTGSIHSLFNTNIYYPYNNTLAYSETFITSSILAMPILKIINEPIATVNFTVLSSLILVPFSIFLLSWYLTKNFLASLLSGTLILFAPVFLDKKVHVQVLALEWIPLSALFFIFFHKKRKTRYLILSMFFFLLQMYNSFMPGYFLVFFYFIYILFLYIYERKTLRWLFKKTHFTIVLATLILIVPIVVPYYKVLTTYNAARDIRDSVHFAMQPEDLLYPNEHTRLQNYLLSLPFNQVSQNNEFKPGYLGFVFSFLAIFALWQFVRNFKKNGFIFNSFVSIGLLGLILSLGPVLHLGRQTVHIPFPIPLPYALFYYILPGFQGFRNSARFEMMFVLFIAVAIALMLTQLFKKYSLFKRSLIYAVFILAVIIEYNHPMKFYSVPAKSDFPAVYHWLNTTPKNSVSIIMPIYDWYMYGVEIELMRDYYSTINWRNTVNGASGYAPPQWQRLVATLHKEFPSKGTVQTLKKLEVNYIIVDKNSYDKAFNAKNHHIDGKFVIEYLMEDKSLQLIKSSKNYYIFEFNTRGI